MDVLRFRNISVAQFAAAVGETSDDVEALIDGRLSITIALAGRLSRVLGASVEYWMSRDFLYREGAGRLQSEHVDWLATLPLGDMIRFGWIKPAPRATEEAVAALRFFGVPSVDAWKETYGHVREFTSFRTSAAFELHPGAAAAWLREGERRAADLSCAPWNRERFRHILNQVRLLSRIGDPLRFLPRLRDICASAGVAVVPLQAPTGCRASGAARFVSSDKALLLVSFRYLTDDHFWYTFFHEAAHILLHGSSDVFVDDLSETGHRPITSDKAANCDLFNSPEREADAFAASILIPEAAQSQLHGLRSDANAILRFAKRIGVSPGIVVGQLQHLGFLRLNQLNSLKRRYAWTESGVVRKGRQPRKAM